MTASTRNFPDPVAAAIFDFDETMIDLEPQHTSASVELCRSFGDDYATLPESWRHGSGRRVIDDVQDLRVHFGWQKPVHEIFALRQSFFDRACAEAPLELMAGVEESVRALHAAGIVLAITSSAVRGSIEAILRRFGLRDRFALIVDGSEVERGKPDPQAYRLTAEKLGVDPAHCIVFEDSTVGVTAAKSAGMFCVAVRNPRAQMRQELDAADVVLDSFEELSYGAPISSSTPSSRNGRSAPKRGG